jgi:hypothetical protein
MGSGKWGIGLNADANAINYSTRIVPPCVFYGLFGISA